MNNIDLLPRADLPVIWNEFKTKADAVWSVAESLVVTDVSQKEAMALARKTRLTLRDIRIAVEHKRVELGEGHLKEIQKVNGAAKAIREFIEPLEARLLFQESFAERVEADRVIELTKFRNDEVRAIWPGCPGDFGKMSETEYAALIARLRKDAAEIAEAKRRQVEAEAKLAAEQAEAKRVAEITRAALELTQRVALEEKQRRDAEVERQRKETEAFLNAKLEAQRKESEALAVQQAEDYKREREEYERKAKAARIFAQQEQARLDAEKAVRDANLAEQKRIQDEQYAVLEAELAQANAAKQAEAKRVMELALAPDVEKLWQFAVVLRGVQVPGMVTDNGIVFAKIIYSEIESLASDIESTCKSWGLTTK